MTEQEIREQFFRTRDAGAMLIARTALVDQIVRERWAWMPPGLALVAVGGYGRAELFPYSDIDLLILTPDQKTQGTIREPLSMLLRDLWDKNLRISQSVHTPDECNLIDESNAELSVSLLDRRFLAGDAALLNKVRDPRPELGRGIARLTRNRHLEFQNTIYHLEPDVKNAPGGLRDVQVLRWLSKLCANPEQAAGEPLPADTAVLFEVRCFLHYLAGRDDNRFTFERQDEIAALIGAASPEDLMRRYYRAVRGIARLATRRLDCFETKGGSIFSQFLDRTTRLSSGDFSVLRGEVSFRDPRQLDRDPDLVLRLAEFVAGNGLALTPDTLDRVERVGRAPLFEVWARSQHGLLPRLRRMILQPAGGAALRLLHESGALESIFPELREIEALVIRDFYHRYTVDEHTLVAIQSVLDLRTAKENGKDDNFALLANETDDFDLLAIALLFHDVGKGTPDEGHVTASARVAEKALRRVGISERALGIVSFLIMAHLELSAAIARDLSDPEVIREVAAKVGTVEHLRLLTLLTWADINAVNPAAMTPWRRQLLWKLYLDLNNELTRELTAHITGRDLPTDPRLRAFLEGLPPRYLRVHSEPEIREHMRLDLEGEKAGGGVAVSLVFSEVWTMNVVAADRPFLFASVAAALSSFGFNIVKAEAFANARGKIIDTFVFADIQRTLELNPEEIHQVTEMVLRAARGEVAIEQLMQRRAPVKPDFRLLANASVSFDNAASPSSTLIELTTQDRPGLLCDIASVISKRGGNIEVVLVDTEAKKAIDVFYVTRNGHKMTDGEAGELVGALTEVARPA